MSSCVSFHTQIASIMEVLANTAVAEICKLVDDGYAVLRLEVSDSREENKALKRKLQLMEMRLAREACVNSRPERSKVCTVLRPSVRDGESLPGARKVFRKRKERPLTQDGKADGTTLDVDITPIRPVDTWDECLDLEEERTESLLIKEEKREEESDLHKGPHYLGDAAELGANGRGRSPALDSGTGSRKGLDKITDPEQHGSRRGGWEVSGLDSDLKAEEQNDCVTAKRLQHRGSERSLGSECVMFERDSHLGNFFSQEDGVAGVGDLSCLSRTAANSDAILAQTEPQYESAGSGNSASSLSSLDWKTGIVVIDSMPIKEETEMHATWSREAFSGAVDALSRSSGNRREREVEILDTVVDPGPMRAPITARQETPEVQEYGVSANHFTASEQSDKLSFRVSSRGKRFFCAFCGKGFSCPKKVEIHQRVHTGEKPFSCTQCRKQFAQAGNLKRHQRVHTGEKPFSCTQCEKRFSHLHQLKMHLKVHTGERPFACPHCGKRFAERSYLRIHQQRNHSVVYSIR